MVLKSHNIRRNDFVHCGAQNLGKDYMRLYFQWKIQGMGKGDFTLYL